MIGEVWSLTLIFLFQICRQSVILNEFTLIRFGNHRSGRIIRLKRFIRMLKHFFILLISFWLVTLFLPWWALVIPAIFLGAVFFQNSIRAFTLGFLSLSAAWLFQILYIDMLNESILSSRIADMAGLGHSWMIIAITALLGGLLGGTGTLFGSQIRAVLRPRSVPG